MTTLDRPLQEPIGNDVGDGLEALSDFNRVCPVCRTAFYTSGRGRYCSGTCRQRALRARRRAAAFRPDAITPAFDPFALAGHTVYECPSCRTRLLGWRRCPKCHLMCRRLGLGGPCPHCTKPVAVDELLL